MRSLWLALAVSMSLHSLAQAEGLTLSSPDIQEGHAMAKTFEFKGFGCDGENLSPALKWSGVPEGTQSLAITVYDPDAPTGSGWWHWGVVNLPASLRELPRGAGSAGGQLPAGAVQTRTDFGQPGFGGACPPQGDQPHHYQFTLWALKVPSLPLDAQASGALVGYMLNQHVLQKATLTATYQR